MQFSNYLFEIKKQAELHLFSCHFVLENHQLIKGKELKQEP